MSVFRSLARPFATSSRGLLRTLQTPKPPTRYIRSLASGTTPNTGFSYPGPRNLSEIVKIQLLNKHTTARVKQIWDEYHRDHKTAIADVLSPEQYSLLQARTKRCPHFVLPVPREGGYFTLLVQFQEKQCFMTFLEHYKTNATGAQPWLTLTIFDEMLNTKNLVLLRAEVTNMLTRQEAKVLIELIKNFYLGQGKTYDTVVAFNEAAENFDFNTVLRAAGISS